MWKAHNILEIILNNSFLSSALNGIFVFLFGLQPNRGHSDQMMRTVDVDPPWITDIVPLGVRHIGTENLGDLLFEGKGNKEGQNNLG